MKLRPGMVIRIAVEGVVEAFEVDETASAGPFEKAFETVKLTRLFPGDAKLAQAQTRPRPATRPPNGKDKRS